MLLRFIAENIFSFKDATEFNTFPSSKSHSHESHKIVCSHATALRLAGVYGANGAGKSNLLLAIRLLRNAVISGTLDKVAGNDDMAFRFDPSCSDKTSGLAIEFFQGERIFYYHLEFKGREVVFEELLLSKKTKDVMVFRVKNFISLHLIHLNSKYYQKPIHIMMKILKIHIVSH